MMRLIKRIIGIFTLVLVVGSLSTFVFTYVRNKPLLDILMANSVVRGSIAVLRIMGLSILGFIVGLLCFSFWLRLGTVVRRIEKEKQEALLEQQRESDEINRQLRKEAEAAKAEAEQAKKENELMKMTFMRKEDENSEEVEEQV